MKILFENKKLKPKVSFILLDWSCRESFHMLHYLNQQTVARDQCEILWIEYYSRQPAEIEKKLQECQSLGQPPVVDQWITMDMPEDVYYHKHLMYNLGIVAARGEIITICDSDAMVKPTFVQSIIEAFADHTDQVLHLDEVRSQSKRFYPFNYPQFEEVTGEGCLNWRKGKTKGVQDRRDPLHTRNYGACMAARKQDLIEIGGADEHRDYLGHICGPYELTFRLINAGKKEIWHEDEFLYHTWHPGTDGRNNYLGPHDGRNMSTTALSVIRTGRIMPLVENAAIQVLRTQPMVQYVSPLGLVIPRLEIPNWEIRKLRSASAWASWTKTPFSFRNLGRLLHHFPLKLKMVLILLKVTLLQIRIKAQSHIRSEVMKKTLMDQIHLAFLFIWRRWQNNLYTAQTCREVLRQLSSQGIKEVALYGTGPVVEMLKALTRMLAIKISDTCPAGSDKIFSMKGNKIIIAGFTNIGKSVETLEQYGIPKQDIVRLQ